MKYLNAIILVLIVEGFLCHAQVNRPKHLFRIYENSKFGFIDSTGKVIIRPIFHSAEEFSEGLAAARINGTYGYIDKDGKFVIQPQFEYATKFKNGYAIVCNERKPFYINRKGERTFDSTYQVIGQFRNGRAKVKTVSHKYGMIDTEGNLCIDTVYSELNDFINGIAVVKGLNRDTVFDTLKTSTILITGTSYMYNTGAIDSHGNMVIPFGKYSYIHDMKDGYFQVTLIPEKNDSSNKKGASNIFIDKMGNLKTSNEYQNIRNEKAKPKRELSEKVKNMKKDNNDNELIYFTVPNPDTNTYYDKLTGIKKADGAILVKPKIQEIYGLGFNHGVLTCFINYKLTYINPKGEVIWQESEMGNRFQSLTDLNIDFINETNYRVFSANDSRKRIYRSFVSGCISETHRSFNSKSNSLNLEVHTEIKDTFTVDTFRLAKNGSAVYVTNTTNDSLEFYSQGTYLNMLVQALNQRGEWKNIEQLPTGNCIDNSRILTLAPNHFWKFATPKYEGDFKTKLRIAIKYIDPTDTTDDLR